MKKNSFLFKDVKEYNKYLLSIISIFILLLTGIISYNYTNSSYAKWISGNTSSNVMKLSIKSGMDATEFATAKVGTDGLEVVTHTIDSTLQVGSEFATEYRYRGGDLTVKNYVTFNNETWRIIGILPTEDTSGNVENRFKLIRDTSIGDYYWNTTQDSTTSSYNNWVTGTLNTYLNGTYYNSLSSDAQNMMGTAKYYLGGYSSKNITSDTMWQYERKNNANRSGYYYGTNPVVQSDASKKIALMYLSDYGYASSTSCTKTIYNYYASSDCYTNWLYKLEGDSIYELDEWSVTQYSIVNNEAFFFHRSDYDTEGIVNSEKLAVRPVLSLSSSVKIIGGTGTSSDPYQLSM